MPGGSLPPRLARPGHPEANGHGQPVSPGTAASRPPKERPLGTARAAWADLDAEDAARIDAERRGSEFRRLLEGTERVVPRRRSLPAPAVVLGLLVVLLLAAAGWLAYRTAPSGGTSQPCQAAAAQPAAGTSLQDLLERCSSSGPR